MHCHRVSSLFQCFYSLCFSFCLQLIVCLLLWYGGSQVEVCGVVYCGRSERECSMRGILDTSKTKTNSGPSDGED